MRIRASVWSAVVMSALMTTMVWAGGYKVGDEAADFSLKNIDGSMLSMASLQNAKGVIVVFTCNHCPYAVAYEDRIIEMHKKFAAMGYPVVAINPNDTNTVPDDNFSKMVERAAKKEFPFPYLIDPTQQTAKSFGATRTPHIFLLQKQNGKFFVRYIGAIDDNAEDAKLVKTKYVEQAVAALEGGKLPSPDFVKAVGCTIKWTKN